MLNLILVLSVSFFSAFFMWKAIDASGQVGFKLSFIFIVAIFATMYVTAKLVAGNASLQFLFLVVYVATEYGVCANALSARH